MGEVEQQSGLCCCGYPAHHQGYHRTDTWPVNALAMAGYAQCKADVLALIEEEIITARPMIDGHHVVELGPICHADLLKDKVEALPSPTETREFAVHSQPGEQDVKYEEVGKG